MTSMLYTSEIYNHISEHFSTIDVRNLETFEAVKEYRSINAWMLLPYEDYYKHVNSPPSTTMWKIEDAINLAKQKLYEDTNNMSTELKTKLGEQLTITKQTPLTALRSLTMNQARVCLMEHYDKIEKEYDITNINTAPAHQLVYDLYFAMEEYQRWRPDEQPTKPGKRRKTHGIVQNEDIDMDADEDEINWTDYPNLMQARKYTWPMIQKLPMNTVEQCLREYYSYSNTLPEDDYWEFEEEKVLRQHMFEATVAILIDDESEITTTTTDTTIEQMDSVHLYKELHNIHLMTNPKYKFQDTIAVTVNFARQTVRKYRDKLIAEHTANNMPPPDLTSSMEQIERLTMQDIRNSTTHQLQLYLRSYHSHTKCIVGEEFYTDSKHEVLQSSLKHIVLTLLQKYTLGIKSTVTDEEIDNMDEIFLYKELHKIRLLQQSDACLLDTTYMSVHEAKKAIKKYRDNLSECEGIIDDIEDNTDVFFAPIASSQGEQSIAKEMLTDAQIRELLVEHAAKQNVILRYEDVEKYSQADLQRELIKYRNQNNDNGTQGNAYEKLTVKGKMAQNLYGVYAAIHDPASQQKKNTKSNTNLPPPKENDREDANDVVPLTRTTTYIRPKVSFNGPKVDATTVIKSYILQLRKADSHIQILPIDENNMSSNDILESETALPNDQGSMKKWVEQVEVVGRRLFFVMRIGTIDIEKVKSHIFQWCGSNGSYTKFSKEKNVNIFGAGWIHGLSAEHYNRDHILQYITNQNLNFRDKVIIYAKEVYHYRTNNNKSENICYRTRLLYGNQG